jgi:hypothetical protein
MDFEKIKAAVDVVMQGISKRVDIDKNTKVYAVGENVIRIDIKKEEK